jgi:hypothetical protein
VQEEVVRFSSASAANRLLLHETRGREIGGVGRLVHNRPSVASCPVGHVSPISRGAQFEVPSWQRVLFPACRRFFFLFSKASCHGLLLTRRSGRWVPAACSSGIKWPGRGTAISV